MPNTLAFAKLVFIFKETLLKIIFRTVFIVSSILVGRPYGGSYDLLRNSSVESLGCLSLGVPCDWRALLSAVKAAPGCTWVGVVLQFWET